MPKHDPLRTPSSYPVSLDEFMRLVIGGRLKADRFRLFRAYLRDSSPPSQRDDLDRIEAIITRYKNEPLEEFWFYQVRADFIRWRAMQRAAKARNAATKRWENTQPQSASSEP